MQLDPINWKIQWKVGAIFGLIGTIAFVSYPLVARWLRVNDYKKLLHSRRGEADSILISKFEGLVKKADWKEALLVADLLCPMLRDDAAAVLHCAAVYLETGDMLKARSAVRRAKAIFRRDPSLRVEIERRNKSLFWKVGFLLREPGV